MPLDNQDKEIFGETDPLTHWQTRVTNRQKELQLSDYAISEAPKIVKALIGQKFDKIYSKKNVNDRLNIAINELGSAFHAVNNGDILEIIELAAYAKALLHIDGFDDVAKSIVESYRSSFLHLAFAYRFKKLNPTSFRLEPPSAGGLKADIAAEFENLRFQVECYRPDEKEKPGQELQREVGLGADAVAKALKAIEGKTLCVHLCFANEIVTTQDRVLMKNSAIDAIGKLDLNSLPITHDLSCGHFVVEERTNVVTDTDTGDWLNELEKQKQNGLRQCLAVSSKSVSAEDVRDSYQGKRVEFGGELSHFVIVWAKHQDFGAAKYDAGAIARKLADKKIKQTKNVEDNAIRIVIVEFPEYSIDFFSEVQRELEKMATHYTNLVLIFVSRWRRKDKRWAYGISYTMTNPLPPPEAAIIMKLVSMENTLDPIADCF